MTQAQPLPADRGVKTDYGKIIALRGVDIDVNPGEIVTGIGALVLLYCAWYFKADDPSLWRFSSVFTAFAGAMLGLVFSDNLLALYVFWELTSVTSFLLIAFLHDKPESRRSSPVL